VGVHALQGDATAWVVCAERARGGGTACALSGVPKGGEERGRGTAPACGGDQDTGGVDEAVVGAAGWAVWDLWFMVGLVRGARRSQATGE